MAEPIEITTRGDRGFHQYGPEIRDSYGTKVSVYESSSAEGPHVWIRVDSSAWVRPADPGVSFAHLSQEQAEALILRLRAWLDEIPSRWGSRAED